MGYSGIWGIQRDTVGCRGIQRDAAGYSGMPRHTAGCSGIQRDAAGYSGIPRDAGGCRGMQRDTAGYSGIQRETMKIYSRARVPGHPMPSCRLNDTAPRAGSLLRERQSCVRKGIRRPCWVRGGVPATKPDSPGCQGSSRGQARSLGQAEGSSRGQSRVKFCVIKPKAMSQARLGQGLCQAPVSRWAVSSSSIVYRSSLGQAE